MPISVQPWAAYHCDSARVENLGPSITTSVPVLAGTQPFFRATATACARTDGQYGSANGTCTACSS
jgi:hypothetical protein